MDRFTPGPWVHYDDSQDGKTNRHEIVAMGKTICRIYLSVPGEDAANARLIASAPDLIAALRLAHARFALLWPDRQPSDDAAWQAVHEAIGSATGNE